MVSLSFASVIKPEAEIVIACGLYQSSAAVLLISLPVTLIYGTLTIDEGTSSVAMA